MPFGWYPCALFIKLSSLYLWQHVIGRKDCPPHIVCVTIIGIPGWTPTEYDKSDPNCGLRSTSVVTQVIKCGYGKEGRAVIRSHTGRVSKLDSIGFVDLANHGPCTHPTVLG